MLITNYRVLILFALQFAVAVGGAAGALLGAQAGLVAGGVALVAGWLTLQMGWSARERKDALKSISDGVAVCGLLVFLLLLFTEGLMVALGALLFAMQLALNLVLREYRQLYFGLVVSFVFILGGAAEALSGTYLLALLAYGLITSFCFGEIWLDRHGAPDGALPRPSLWRRLRVAGVVLCIALAFYLVMPRPPAANLGSQQFSASEYYSSEQWEQAADQPGEAGEGQPDSGGGTAAREREDRGGSGSSGESEGFAYSGFDDQFDIRDPAEEGGRNINAILAYMKAPHGSYLTLRTFDTFDGIRWSANTSSYTRHRVERGRITLLDDAEGNYRQVFRIEETLPAFLPVAPRPVELWLPASVIAQDYWGQPLLPGRLRAGTQYTVDSRLQWHRDRLVNGDRQPQATDLQLPEDLDPRIPELAQRVTRQAGGDFQRAEALEHHLRTQYDYSFESVFDSQGETPLPRFLFEERAGHCEYFASAMVVMLRSLDIPARLVTGFSATQKNPMTGYYEIRGLDGHAWAEAWVPEAGWVTFEPTAFYDLPRPQEERLSAEQINEYVERLQRMDEALASEEWTPGRILSSLWQSLASAFVVVMAWLKLALLTLWPALLALAVLAAGLLFTRDYWQPRLTALVSHWRIRQYRPARVREALHFYLEHLQRIAASRGIDRFPGEPVEYWSRRLQQVWQEDEALDRLVAVVNQAFYEQESVTLESVRQAALGAARTLVHRPVSITAASPRAPGGPDR